MAPPPMKTGLGLWYYLWMQPIEWIAKIKGQATLEEMLVTRHRCIDQLLNERLNSPEDYQVVELAAGLSSRGLRTMQADTTKNTLYLEGDLDGIIKHKTTIFQANQWNRSNHHLMVCDLLAPNSYQPLKDKLSVTKKTIVIAEGILSYFDTVTVAFILRECFQLIKHTSGGCFICDAHFSEEVSGVRGSSLFQKIQSNFVKSPMLLPWQNEQQARLMLSQAGFTKAEIFQAHQILDSARQQDGIVRIVQAQCG